MVLNIQLSPEEEARLRQKAEAAGKDALTFAREAIQEKLRAQSVDDLLAPLRRQFADTGTSDEQLIAEIEHARDALHAGNPDRNEA